MRLLQTQSAFIRGAKCVDYKCKMHLLQTQNVFTRETKRVSFCETNQDSTRTSRVSGVADSHDVHVLKFCACKALDKRPARYGRLYITCNRR